MPSFLATVAGFMDWEFAEVIVQGYLAGCPQGTNPVPNQHRISAGSTPDQHGAALAADPRATPGGTVNMCPQQKKHPRPPTKPPSSQPLQSGGSCASRTWPV